MKPAPCRPKRQKNIFKNLSNSENPIVISVYEKAIFYHIHANRFAVIFVP